ncbi:secretin and TonB N-terminal domain-containing protein [Geminocystis sp. CENA526]|uniref:secretin and TonB N-terminal domain-containing protein n=1 Tax=Geminocystis sp. CENA526 TaxID=1355871 RepID=UPI003D701194
MIKFSFHQIKFLSSSAVILLCWQSLALANPSVNKKLTLKKPPNWIAQAFPQNQDVLVPNPTIKINGQPVNNQPAPPPFTRAVAPPVGDMSISNVNTHFPVVDLGTNATVPRLVLRDAPATEVLALLSRAAGLNIIFTDQSAEGQTTSTVSLDLQNEPVQDVFNNVLMVSGLRANRQGNTIFVGNKLPPSVKNTITRSVRLNQYSAIGAASFLNSQGAQGNIVEVEIADDGKRTFTVKKLESEEKDNEFLVLKGLTVHADPIHDTVTLVGEPHLIQKATNFLTQLDIRRRQVAVNVKVVDVQLDQRDSFGLSFSWGLNDTGVVQSGGIGVINFGTNQRNVDPQQWRVDDNQQLVPFPDGEVIGIPNTGRISPFGSTASPGQPGNSAVVIPGGNFNVPQAFLAQIRANISSGNAKILTDPTLVVQEGQIGSVELVENVVTSVNTEIDPLSSVRTTTPVIEPAGLTLSVAIQKIDDNGFINLVANPTISAPGSEQQFESGPGAVNIIRPLIERKVSSGLIRLRDGQTLILSGIITDQERTNVSKVPILGDLPIIGSLFRSTFKDNRRSEVIVMLTPQILDDGEGNSGFGYNYSPSRETGQFLRERGLNVPSNPF